ncbi:type IV secretory system conjugative DNA transfer family protein [Burkholderia pseudomallei]|uniref:type IV secretory system conjugative DNA transfer family protein n=1 Tax=Burkholderia pseudomallei TaxID=28450 RepID=UPI000A1C92B4|nr:type IV secretory system conjugative DNA transfer family protein [Burkholderia pseudomallei]MCL4667207.1 type IV secretory system conjugative DNA transfer family protein [Burkholderia pseudomallei]
MQGQGVLFGQVAIVFSIVSAGVWAATQWTAAALGYQLRLGAPWFDWFGTPVYHPWELFPWWFAYDAYAPRIFNIGGAIAGGSGLVAVAVAIVMSVWRSRQSKLVTTYGSARWADVTDIHKAGLDQSAGVFLGLYRRQYLRHEGPEHVLTFAPTRSGKGVGLVVPTLLSWPASAVKLRYYADANFKRRVLPPPVLTAGRYADVPPARSDHWSALAIPAVPTAPAVAADLPGNDTGTADDGGPRRQPELSVVAEYNSEPQFTGNDLALLDDDDDLPLPLPRQCDPAMQRTARLASLDQQDGIEL